MLILVNEAHTGKTFAIVSAVNVSSCALEQILGRRKYLTLLGFREASWKFKKRTIRPFAISEKKKKKQEGYIAYFQTNVITFEPFKKIRSSRLSFAHWPKARKIHQLWRYRANERKRRERTVDGSCQLRLFLLLSFYLIDTDLLNIWKKAAPF